MVLVMAAMSSGSGSCIRFPRPGGAIATTSTLGESLPAQCEKLEALQMHENSAVYERAARILDEYYGEGDAEDAAIAPQSTADGYSFGVSPR